ncbi:hypothetical protein FOA52_010935 [Chlamydomonas sp. UWO 241]|nr:hypothetical protein FOA52_010935 [Chlamydomonas sp. UWO 241]
MHHAQHGTHGSGVAHTEELPPPAGSHARSVSAGRLPEAVVIVTHHKTGTVMAGCIVWVLGDQMKKRCGHHTTTPYVTDEILKMEDLGMHMKRARAASQEAGVTPVMNPYLILRTDHAPKAVCFDTAGPAKDLGSSAVVPVSWGKDKRACQKQKHVDCPCHGGTQCCRSIGKCHFREPEHADVTYLHFIRNPADIVLSAYSYHLQDPPVEPWLKRSMAPSQRKRILASLQEWGVANETMEMARAAAPEGANFWKFLRSLPEDAGVLAELARSEGNMWRMARLAHRWRMIGHARNIRYEELQANPISALGPLLDTVSSACFIKHNASIMEKLVGTCHTKSWSKKKIESSNHVDTSSTDVQARRAAILLGNPGARAVLEKLQAALGYVKGQWSGMPLDALQAAESGQNATRRA